MTVTLKVSPAAKVAVPVSVGVVSRVVKWLTVGASGALVLISSSLVVVSLMALPNASAVVAVTL